MIKKHYLTVDIRGKKKMLNVSKTTIKSLGEDIVIESEIELAQSIVVKWKVNEEPVKLENKIENTLKKQQK